MSSIRRARSAASRAASAAEAGIISASPGARSRRSRRMARPQARVNSVRASWRARRDIAGGRMRPSVTPGSSRCSSSSASPIGRITGRITASPSPPRRAISVSRKARTARRVGRRTVVPASASGSARRSGTGPRRPSSIASARTERNGAPAGIVKTLRGAAIVSVRRRCRRSTSPPRRSLPVCPRAATARRDGRRTAAPPRSPCRRAY